MPIDGAGGQFHRFVKYHQFHVETCQKSLFSRQQQMYLRSNLRRLCLTITFFAETFEHSVSVLAFETRK